MTPLSTLLAALWHSAAGRVAALYALSWLAPLGWWAGAMFWRARGRAETSELCADCALIAAQNIAAAGVPVTLVVWTLALLGAR